MAGWITDPTTAAERAAAIAISPDQITELNTLANALGTGPRTLEIRHAATGDPWDAGTVVFRATLTGANVVSAGKMRPGRITANGVAAAKNMSTGSAVRRVSNESGRFVQGPLLVGGSEGPRIPASPSGVFSMVMGDDFGFAADPALAPAPDLQLYQVQMVNETAGVQAAGFVSPTFGAPFRQGDIPAGSFPHFKTSGGLECPATLYGISSWPDGSMKLCGVLLRVPEAVPAAPVPGTGSGSVPGTLAIQVRSGGAEPAAGTRALSDFTAANITIEMVGLGSSAGLENTWTLALNDAIADGADVALIGSGPAGSVWRVGAFAKNGATAHERLYGHHYAAALSNTNGTLRGLRYLGRVSQPFGNSDISTEARHRDMTMSLSAGGVTARNMLGVSGSSPNDAETTSSTIRVLQFAGVFTAGPSGKWDYFQGAGTTAADQDVRVTHDLAYLEAAKLIPRYDRTIPITAHDILEYYPNCKGATRRNMPDTSDGPETGIGLLPNFATRNLALQDASHERAGRVTSLAGGGWRYMCYDKTTRKPVAFHNHAAYSGMAAQPNWRTRPGNYTGGIVVPTVNSTMWAEEQGHHPASHYLNLLLHAEPQSFDLAYELGAKIIAFTAPGNRTYDLTEPITASSYLPETSERTARIRVGGAYSTSRVAGGVGCVSSNGFRETAWAMRDLAQAAALMPDVDPQGVGKKAHLMDALNNSLLFMQDYRNAAPTWMRAQGAFHVNGRNSAFKGSTSPWMKSFFTKTIAQLADIVPSALANEARAYEATYWRTLNAQLEIGDVFAYRELYWEGNNLVGVDKVTYRTSGADTSTTIAFAAATSTGTISNGGINAPSAQHAAFVRWTPQNGDVLTFNVEGSADVPSPTLVEGDRVYLINVSGLTFQISRTPGGAPITIPADITITGFHAQSKVGAPSLVYRPEASHYSNIAASAVNMLRWAGEDVSAVGDKTKAYVEQGIANSVGYAYPFASHNRYKIVSPV